MVAGGDEQAAAILQGEDLGLGLVNFGAVNFFDGVALLIWAHAWSVCVCLIWLAKRIGHA